MSQAKTLSDDELNKLLLHASYGRYPERDRLMILLTYCAGLRVGELASLSLSDVANADGTAKTEIHLRPSQTKGRKSRTVMVSERLAAEIETYISASMIDPSGPLLVSQKSKRNFTSVGLANHFKSLYVNSGLDNGSSHSGRRTFITNLAHRGVNVRIIQELVGHKNMNTTQMYIDVSDISKMNAVNLL